MTALDLSRSTSGVYLTPEQSNEIWTGVFKQSAVTQLATGVKLPGSGMAEANDYGNYAWLTPRDEVKFVVSSREDFEFACDVIRRYDLAAKTPNLLFSPVWGRVEFADLAAWVVESRLPVRMQLQMHKLIWGDRPGV